jgi:hypothetical protein
MDVTLSDVAMLPTGDFEKLDKREREEFHATQERMIQMLIQASNHFQIQFPNLKVEWRFQAEVYQSVQASPSTVRYSQRIY